MDGWMDRQRDGQTDRWMEVLMDGGMEGWTDRWTDGQTDIWMNGQTNG